MLTNPIHDARAVVVSGKPQCAERIAGDLHELGTVQLARFSRGVEHGNIRRVPLVSNEVTTEHSQARGNILHGPRHKRAGRESDTKLMGKARDDLRWSCRHTGRVRQRCVVEGQDPDGQSADTR